MKMIHETRQRKGRFHPETIQERLHKRYYIDLVPDYHASLILAGTGRSGTTWISEVINYRNEYRLMDEPFRNVSVDIVAHFNAMQYIRPDDSNEVYLEPVAQILSGRLRNSWTDRFNTRTVASQRLIKAIRANLFLKWMYNHFPGLRIAFLMRHPCAVVLSQWKLDWDIDLEAILLAQPQLMADHLEPYREEIEQATDLFEKRLWMWAVENYMPLAQFNPGEVHFAFYENFCEEPEQEIEKLFRFYGKEWDESVLAAMRKPSNSSKPDSAVVSGKRRVDSWMSKVTDEQQEMVERMLKRFGLDAIYSADSPFPKTENVNALLGRSLQRPQPRLSPEPQSQMQPLAQ